MSAKGNPDFTTHNYADFDVDEGFEPEMYDAMIRKGIPAYDRLQREVAALVTGRQGLELGTGLGATTLQAWHANDFAQILCVDMAENMLADAAARLTDLPVRFLQQRLEDPLPAGPFDTVFSALAVHHLDGPAKADLFVRVAAVLAPGRPVRAGRPRRPRGSRRRRDAHRRRVGQAEHARRAGGLDAGRGPDDAGRLGREGPGGDRGREGVGAAAAATRHPLGLARRLAADPEHERPPE